MAEIGASSVELFQFDPLRIEVRRGNVLPFRSLLLVALLLLGACARTDSTTAIDSGPMAVPDTSQPIPGKSLPSNGSNSDSVGQALGTMTNP